MASPDTVKRLAWDDRHHFRFIVSPEDAAELENLRTFTRELLDDVERDLGTELDWVAVDRLFAAAELRIGGEHQQTVRISRTDGRVR